MFDLEQSITKWRQRMQASGIKSADTLEELECHLRDDVEHQMNSGLDAAQAFAAAVQRIGAPVDLEREFQRTSSNEQMKTRLRKILTGIAILATGLGLVLPVIAKWRAGINLAGEDGILLSIGTTLILGGLAWGAIGIATLLRQRSKA